MSDGGAAAEGGQPYYVSYEDMKKAVRHDLNEDMRNNFLNNTRVRPTRQKLREFMQKDDADKTLSMLRKKVRSKEPVKSRKSFDALKEVDRERLELRQELAGEESDDSSVVQQRRKSRKSGRKHRSRQSRSGRPARSVASVGRESAVTIPDSEAIFGPYQYYREKDEIQKARRMPRRLECPNLDKVCRELDQAERTAMELKKQAAEASRQACEAEEAAAEPCAPCPDPCKPKPKVTLQELQDMTDKITIMRVLVQRDEEKVRNEVDRLEEEILQMQQHGDELRLGRRRAERILGKNLDFDRSSDVGSLILDDSENGGED